MAINAGSIIAFLDLDTGKFSTKLSEAQKQTDGFAGKLKRYGGAFEDLGKGLTLGVTAPIIGLGGAAAKTAIDFESAFAGVKKTVDATDEQLAKLGTGIRDMAKEIPASATAIAGVAEAAGQLGIETDNILGFTRVMVDLGEATNLSAEEAATSFAKFANIVGMSQQDFDKLGSVVVELGNNLATTEADIVSMAMRLAGAGSQIGLSEAEIMSFSGALSSVGIEAEAGGSAFSKVMIDMQLAVETGSDKLKDFAGVAGMSAEEFSKAFKDDAAGAIISFIQGLGSAEEKGMSAIKVLDDMGITEIRLRDSLLRAAGASDVFTDAIALGTDAWDENNALTKEAEQRYATTASQIEIAKNHLKDAGITIGEIVVPQLVSLAEGVKKVSEWFSNLNPKTQESIVKMAGLAAAVGPILLVGGKMASGLSSIIGLFSKFGVGAKVASTAASVLSGAGGLGSIVATGTQAGGVIASLGGAAGTGGALGGLGAGLGASLLAIAPWALAIGGAGLVAYGLSEALKEEVVPAFEMFDDTISESTKEALGNFMELEKQATVHLNQLAFSGMEVTTEMKENITSNTNQMVDQVVLKLEEQKTEGLAHLKEMLDGSTEMSEQEKTEAIRIATEKYDAEIEKATTGKARIEEILQTALTNNTKITDAERIEMERILDSLKTNSITLMTESQAEQETILNNLKTNADRITLEMASEVIGNSAKQREKTIAEANKEYNERIKFANSLKTDGTKASIELANNIIREAEKQKNESIAKAKQMHSGIVTEVKKQGGDVITQLNTDNGKIKTAWGNLKTWFSNNPVVRWVKTQQDEGPTKYSKLNQGHNAHGTNHWRGGPTWVGEQGPELIELPEGSKVHTNKDSMGMMGGEVKHSGTIRVEGVNNNNELIGVVDMVMDQLRREVRL